MQAGIQVDGKLLKQLQRMQMFQSRLSKLEKLLHPKNEPRLSQGFNHALAERNSNECSCSFYHKCSVQVCSFVTEHKL